MNVDSVIIAVGLFIGGLILVFSLYGTLVLVATSERLRDRILYKEVKEHKDCPYCEDGLIEAHNSIYGAAKFDCATCGGDGYIMERRKVRRFGSD